jgi:hypothetical protein
VLGSDTMAQYNKLFGAAPPMGVPPTTQFDPVQVAAANGDALQAAAKGATSMASVLNDADGYGSLPSPPIGDYETMSPAEMMSTEAQRRFADSEWNKSITGEQPRPVGGLPARDGCFCPAQRRDPAEKERMEALMALYTSRSSPRSGSRSMPPAMRAQRADVQRSIK